MKRPIILLVLLLAVAIIAFLLLLPRPDTSLPVPVGNPLTEQSKKETEPVETRVSPERSAVVEEPRVESLKSGETSAGELSITTLKGRVVYGAFREPLPGILVKFFREGERHSQCLTDKTGTFTQSLSNPGEWEVVAFPYRVDGYHRSMKFISGAPGEIFTELHVPARLDFHVSGRVSNKEGVGIDGVHVRLHWYPHGQKGVPPLETATDVAGEYNFPKISLDLPKPKARNSQSVDDESSYSGDDRKKRSIIHVSFSHPDYRGLLQSKSLLEWIGRETVVDATLLRCGIVRGFVVTPGGETADGVRLPWHIQDQSGISSIGSAEIKGGSFSIRIECAGTLTISGNAGKYQVCPLTVGAVDTNTVMESIRVQLDYR